MISLKIKTNHPDQSNPKYYAQGRWFFSKPLGKSLFFIAKMSGLTMIQLASSDFWKVPLVSSLHSPHCPMVLLLIPTAVCLLLSLSLLPIVSYHPQPTPPFVPCYPNPYFNVVLYSWVLCLKFFQERSPCKDIIEQNYNFPFTLFYSLQESWGQFVDVCNTISQDRNQNPSEWLNSRGAVDLLASSNITQTNACSYEPIALNCFLNNVVSFYSSCKWTWIFSLLILAYL